MRTLLEVFEKLTFWLVLILVVFIPLYPKFPFLNLKGTFVAIRAEDFLIAVAVLVWALYIIFSKRVKEVLSDKLNQALLVFFFIGVVSTFSAIFLTHTVSPTLSILHFLRRVEFMIFLPIIMTVVKTQKQVKLFLAVSSVVLFIVIIYALGQQYLQFPVISTTNSEFAKGQIIYLTPEGRVNSTFAGHYDLAVYLMMGVVLISALVLSSKNLLINIWYFILGGLSAVVLILTAARFSFIGAIFGGTLALLATGKRKLVYLLFIVVLLVLIYPSQLRERLFSTVSVNLLARGQRYVAPPQPTPDLKAKKSNELKLVEATEAATLSAGIKPVADIAPGEPVDPTQLGVFRSLEIRLNQEWPRAIRAFAKNPLLGTGYSSLGLATDNDYLRILGEAGLLGTMAFALIIMEIVKRVRDNFKTHKDKFFRYFSAGTLAIILAFLLNAFFIDVLEASKVAALFWMLLGINLSLNKNK